MIPQIKELGKVVITPAGYWIKDKAFEHLDLVTNEIDNKSYIAKQNVPAGIEITNVDYWQPIGASGYRNNNFIILSDTEPFHVLLRGLWLHHPPQHDCHPHLARAYAQLGRHQFCGVQPLPLSRRA